MQLSTLAEWLSWIKTVHTVEIELGLERVKLVADRLGVLNPACAVITVGGTNGKGSTVAALSAVYRASQYRVGNFTSPHLFKFNEQVQIDGRDANDEQLCAAFEAVTEARGDIALTPFEYHTLAALWLMKAAALDVMILEVGLGGRLDAVNIIDADVSIVTSISIDHVEYLGPTRETIGFEKAGIFRAERPAICGDKEPPASLVASAFEKNATFYAIGVDFNFEQAANGEWDWRAINGTRYPQLPASSFAKQNLSCALMAVTLLQERLPVTAAQIQKGLSDIKLRGRMEVIPGPVMQIFDVAHNPASVLRLSEALQQMPCAGKTHAVFSMLADKDILQSLIGIKSEIDTWHVSALAVPRAASAQQLVDNLEKAGVKGRVKRFDSIEDAYQAAIESAEKGDRIIVFGSFHTVAAILPLSSRA